MIKLQCPKCKHEWKTKYFKWVFKAPFHWFYFDVKAFRPRDLRKTKCPKCGKKSWIVCEKVKSNQ
jgi:hypothetical protein